MSTLLSTATHIYIEIDIPACNDSNISQVTDEVYRKQLFIHSAVPKVSFEAPVDSRLLVGRRGALDYVMVAKPLASRATYVAHVQLFEGNPIPRTRGTGSPKTRKVKQLCLTWLS